MSIKDRMKCYVSYKELEREPTLKNMLWSHTIYSAYSKISHVVIFKILASLSNISNIINTIYNEAKNYIYTSSI